MGAIARSDLTGKIFSAFAYVNSIALRKDDKLFAALVERFIEFSVLGFNFYDVSECDRRTHQNAEKEIDG